MGIIAWIVAGLLAGLATTMLGKEERLAGNVIAGAIGGFVAGSIGSLFGYGSVWAFGPMNTAIGFLGGLLAAFAASFVMRIRISADSSPSESIPSGAAEYRQQT